MEHYAVKTTLYTQRRLSLERKNKVPTPQILLVPKHFAARLLRGSNCRLLGERFPLRSIEQLVCAALSVIKVTIWEACRACCCLWPVVSQPGEAITRQHQRPQDTEPDWSERRRDGAESEKIHQVCWWRRGERIQRKEQHWKGFGGEITELALRRVQTSTRPNTPPL